MVEVYRTPMEDDARSMRQLLAESGIPSELTLSPAGPGVDDAVLRVEAQAEEAALRVISGILESRGLRAEGGEARREDAVFCPNCGGLSAPREACEECGYAVLAPAASAGALSKLFPDARSVCPDCCVVSTRAAGACPDCGAALEALDPHAPACPEGLHMLVKGEAPGWVCPGCRAAWLD